MVMDQNVLDKTLCLVKNLTREKSKMTRLPRIMTGTMEETNEADVRDGYLDDLFADEVW